MKYNWDKAIDFVLSIEGGYSNDQNDPGGETRYGISKRSYPALDIAHLTVDQAKEIYKKDYWDKLSCDDLPNGIDVIAFDTAVNMGVNISKFMLASSPTYQDFLLNRIDRYIEITRKNATLQKFFRGWIIRCNRLRTLVKGV